MNLNSPDPFAEVLTDLPAVAISNIPHDGIDAGPGGNTVYIAVQLHGVPVAIYAHHTQMRALATHMLELCDQARDPDTGELLNGEVTP